MYFHRFFRRRHRTSDPAAASSTVEEGSGMGANAIAKLLYSPVRVANGLTVRPSGLIVLIKVMWGVIRLFRWASIATYRVPYLATTLSLVIFGVPTLLNFGSGRPLHTTSAGETTCLESIPPTKSRRI